MLEHGELRDAGKRTGLAPCEVLQAPEVSDRVYGQHRRRIVPLLFD